LVVDSLTVNAKNGSGEIVTQTGTASVCFGDCPLNCFNTVNNESAWPSSLEANLNAAAAELASSYPGFAAKVCATGETLNMCYTTNDPPPGDCGAYYARHSHTAKCDMKFNRCGIRDQNDALFMLTHEATHHIQAISGSYVLKFVDQVPRANWPICSYGATNGSSTESMAESDALYATTPSWAKCIDNFSTQYKANYNFAKNVMFVP
jgi:hypothetical protein